MKYPLDRGSYWERRKDQNIYTTTIDWVKKYFPNAQSLIETGCYTSRITCDLEYIPLRITNDIQDLPEWKGVDDVKFIKGDFTKIDWNNHLPNQQNKFDIAISHQTIEHVNNPIEFAQKLLQLSDNVLCSTTFKVPHGRIPGHIHDPISLEQFCEWFQPLNPEHILITSGMKDRIDMYTMLVFFTKQQIGPPVWLRSDWLNRKV